MLRRADPGPDNLVKRVGSHPGVSSRDQGGEIALGQRGQRVAVVGQDRLEGLLLLPFRVLGSQRPDAVEDEPELDIEWLLAPEGAIVVKDGDALTLRHELVAAFCGDRDDEVKDRLLVGTVVPRGKGIVRQGDLLHAGCPRCSTFSLLGFTGSAAVAELVDEALELLDLRSQVLRRLLTL